MLTKWAHYVIMKAPEVGTQTSGDERRFSIMVKDTNTREKVTLTKEQVAEIEEFAKAYNTSRSKIISCLVSMLLSYEAGYAIGDILRQHLDGYLKKPKSRTAASGVSAPKRATQNGKKSKKEIAS